MKRLLITMLFISLIALGGCAITDTKSVQTKPKVKAEAVQPLDEKTRLRQKEDKMLMSLKVGDKMPGLISPSYQGQRGFIIKDGRKILMQHWHQWYRKGCYANTFNLICRKQLSKYWVAIYYKGIDRFFFDYLPMDGYIDEIIDKAVETQPNLDLSDKFPQCPEGV